MSNEYSKGVAGAAPLCYWGAMRSCLQGLRSMEKAALGIPVTRSFCGKMPVFARIAIADQTVTNAVWAGAGREKPKATTTYKLFLPGKDFNGNVLYE